MANFIEGIGPYTITGELRIHFFRSVIDSEESGKRWVVELPWSARNKIGRAHV